MRRYLLNMTLPQVATFLAQYAAQAVTASGTEFNGAFFDSFGSTIPPSRTRIAGEEYMKSIRTATEFRTIPTL